MPGHLRGGSEVAAAGWETRSVGSRGRCEICPELPLPPDPGSSRPLAECPRDAYGRFLGARTRVLAGRATIWAATLGECLPPRPETAFLDGPFRSAQSFALSLR